MDSDTQVICVGDRVRLKSDGRLMTVVEIIQEPSSTSPDKERSNCFQCVWSDTSHKICQARFLPSALIKVIDSCKPEAASSEGRMDVSPNPEDAPLEGVLTADDIREIEQSGLTLEDVIRAIESSQG